MQMGRLVCKNSSLRGELSMPWGLQVLPDVVVVRIFGSSDHSLGEMFEKAARQKSNGKTYQLWQHHNKPIELYSSYVIDQKVNYIHMNSVKEGLVTEEDAQSDGS